MKRIKRGKKRTPTRASGDSEQRLVRELQGRVAVYIDTANLEKSVQALGLIPPKRFTKGMRWRADKNLWHVDYKKLYQFFKKNTQLLSSSFYTASFGTRSHNRFLMFLRKNGYRLVLKPIKTIPGRGKIITCEHCGHKNRIADERKANFDVEISVDALAWINNYDTFILFSGDSDFVYLVRFLKKHGKKIIVLSRRGHVANELRTSKDVDYYQDIWKLRNQFLRKSP